MNTSLVVSPPCMLEEEINDMSRNRAQASSLEDIHEGTDKDEFVSKISQKPVDKDLFRARSFRNVKNTVSFIT